MAKPPSIGDADVAEYRLMHEQHILPPTRREVIARIETLINEGGVQKLVVEMGRPIQLYRLVHKDEWTAPPPDAPSDDLLLQARNGAMEELKVRGNWSPYQVLFFAFAAVSQRKLRPTAFFVKNFAVIRDWLKLDALADLTQIFGVDTVLSKDVPQDCIILVATSYDETNTSATLGLRIPVDLPVKAAPPPGPPDPPTPPPGRKVA